MTRLHSTGPKYPRFEGTWGAPSLIALMQLLFVPFMSNIIYSCLSAIIFKQNAHADLWHVMILFLGKTFWERGGTKWMKASAPSSLGSSLQRRVANPIIRHHSCATHLAFRFFFFSQQAICGFPAGSLRSQCVMTTKHFQGRLGVRQEATKYSLRPRHASRWQLPTQTRCQKEKKQPNDKYVQKNTQLQLIQVKRG